MDNMVQLFLKSVRDRNAVEVERTQGNSSNDTSLNEWNQIIVRTCWHTGVYL